MFEGVSEFSTAASSRFSAESSKDVESKDEVVKL